MEEKTRKASEVLLSMESKMEQILNLVRSQDLNTKLISNKINSIIAQLNSKENNIILDNKISELRIEGSHQMPIEETSVSFRRNSRPDTASIEAENVATIKDELIATQNSAVTLTGDKIAVKQKIVDKNGKAVFLAGIEIFNSNGDSVFKTRTNSTGKWQAALAPGEYKVVIKKKESLSKDNVELIQPIKIHKSSTPIEMPVLIIKIN